MDRLEDWPHIIACLPTVVVILLKMCLVAIGLGLDIIGVLVVATPDIPALAKKFRFGRIKQGQRLMEAGGLQGDQTGFSEITEILEDLDPAAEFSEQDQQFKKIIVNRRGGFTSDEIKESGMRWGSEYVEARRDETGDLETTVFYEPSEVYREIQSVIDPKVTNIRGFGLFIVVLGFVLQLFGTVL